MFFCNYGEYDGQTIFTNQFWWIHWVNKKIMNSPQTNNQKKVKIKENKDSTKYETTLYATCRRNFNTVWGSTQHQKKFKPKANSNNITAHDITVQPTLKVWGIFSIVDLLQLISSKYEEARKWKTNLFMMREYRWMYPFDTRMDKWQSAPKYCHQSFNDYEKYVSFNLKAHFQVWNNSGN